MLVMVVAAALQLGGCGVGEITVQMKITDASTGELLGAALDRRVGGKELSKLWSGWHNADDALQYWAKR